MIVKKPVKILLSSVVAALIVGSVVFAGANNNQPSTPELTNNQIPVAEEKTETTVEPQEDATEVTAPAPAEEPILKPRPTPKKNVSNTDEATEEEAEPTLVDHKLELIPTGPKTWTSKCTLTYSDGTTKTKTVNHEAYSPEAYMKSHVGCP